MITVLLADDHALMRKGFRLILDAEPDIEDFKNRKNIDGFESRFRDALVASLDPESSHLVTISFPIVRGIQICRVDVERSPHPVFLFSKDIPQQFYIRQEGAPPQPVRCPSCGELIHPPEFYVRMGTRPGRWMSGGLTNTSATTGDNRASEFQTWRQRTRCHRHERKTSSLTRA